MKRTTIGLDLAQRIFQVHSVDPDSGEITRQTLKRSQVLRYFANRAASVVAMEACSSSQYRARELLAEECVVPELLRGALRGALRGQIEQIRALSEQIKALERQISSWQRRAEDCRRIGEIPGVGLLTATATVATIGDARSFRSGREFAAFVGLVPRQSGTSLLC